MLLNYNDNKALITFMIRLDEADMKKLKQQGKWLNRNGSNRNTEI